GAGEQFLRRNDAHLRVEEHDDEGLAFGAGEVDLEVVLHKGRAVEHAAADERRVGRTNQQFVSCSEHMTDACRALGRAGWQAVERDAGGALERLHLYAWR